LRIAILGGYAPDLQGCFYCGNTNPDRFNLSRGHLECSSCGDNQDGIRLPIYQGTLDAMRYISYCDDKKLFSFTLGDDALEQLSQVTESYLATQLERGFSTLDFYKTLLIS
jgi:DNA repair protein RecO (recombination protein O)